MNRTELIEQTCAEIVTAAADGDYERARMLAALQRRVITQILRDASAEAAVLPVRQAPDGGTNSPRSVSLRSRLREGAEVMGRPSARPGTKGLNGWT